MFRRKTCTLALMLAMMGVVSCKSEKRTGEDSQVTTLGTAEVTARLLEVPPRAIIERQLYDYASILKYEIMETHRGPLQKGSVIYVAHYNPFKARAAAADKRVKAVGGDVESFQKGATHRMALEAPLDEHYMGGIINEYHSERIETTYWAVWTNEVRP